MLVSNHLPSTEAENDINHNMPIIKAGSDILPNENAELLENEPPENRSPIENGESAPFTPPLPSSNVPEVVVSEEPLITNAEEEHIVCSERPVRLRQVPNRLSYYAPGQACLVQASPLNTVNDRPFINNQLIPVRIPMDNSVIIQFVHPAMPFITPSYRHPIQSYHNNSFIKDPFTFKGYGYYNFRSKMIIAAKIFSLLQKVPKTSKNSLPLPMCCSCMPSQKKIANFEVVDSNTFPIK